MFHVKHSEIGDVLTPPRTSATRRECANNTKLSLLAAVMPAAKPRPPAPVWRADGAGDASNHDRGSYVVQSGHRRPRQRAFVREIDAWMG